jgi:hypothetical protein
MWMLRYSLFLKLLNIWTMALLSRLEHWGWHFWTENSHENLSSTCRMSKNWLSIDVWDCWVRNWRINSSPTYLFVLRHSTLYLLFQILNEAQNILFFQKPIEQIGCLFRASNPEQWWRCVQGLTLHSKPISWELMFGQSSCLKRRLKQSMFGVRGHDKMPACRSQHAAYIFAQPSASCFFITHTPTSLL